MRPALNVGQVDSWPRFAWMLSGGSYRELLHQYSSFPRTLLQTSATFYDQLLVVGLALAAVGLVHLWRRQALLALGLTVAALGNVAFFFGYAVHDPEVFFLPGVVVLTLPVALGAHAAWSWLDRVLGGRWLRLAARPLLFVYPLSLVLSNYGAVDMSGYTAARDYGERLCAELPRRAVIVHFSTPPEWKNHTVFAFYYQLVLRRRQDVRVVRPAAPAQVSELVRRGVPVYLYYPVARVLPLFHLAKDGAAYRIRGVRPRPGGMPPAWR
jgi:hypothetical protein